LNTTEEIARILLDHKAKQILDIMICKENLRFRCRRCATFCCKLGGPNLTKRDVQRIRKAGYSCEEFAAPFKGGSDSLSTFISSLKCKEDGSCIFLKPDSEKGNYECSIYDCRPALCRLYPFGFFQTDFQSIVLRLIPCCMGLNSSDGELVDEQFIVNLLHDAVWDLTV
jgi:Fe-S-cluster containining protein